MPGIIAGMLFTRAQLDGIASGEVRVAFRRWEAPRVRPGSRQRTAIGVVAFDAVREVDHVTDADARAAGDPSAAVLLKRLRPAGTLYRIDLHLEGPDPRAVLRETVPGADELAALRRRVERMAPWAMEYLRTIEARPGVRAPDLAAGFGLQTRPFKARVRRLKELGLTESLSPGYRLSPRGQALLNDESPAEAGLPQAQPEG
jgi:hypothetical protein